MDHKPMEPSRVLAIPELVDLIASYSELSDIARLARVGRRPFNILLPSIWKDVHGAHNLLRLIDSAKLQYSGSPAVLHSIKLKKRKNCDIGEAFKRFDMYAPFVNSLRVYCPKFMSFTVTGWELLNSRAKQGRLLPYLKELTFDKGVRLSRVVDEIQWIDAFGHEALRAVHFARHSELTSGNTSGILDILVRKSPNIQELSLYPRDTHSYRLDSDDNNSACSDSPDSDAESERVARSWDSLRKLIQLRSISVTDEWLGRSFLKALSQLPDLHLLEFHGQRLSELFEPEEIDSYIGKGSFPALRQLTLSHLNPSDVIRVLTSQGMLRNITCFRQNYTPEVDFEDFEERERWIVGRFLPMLVNLPCLTELNVKETVHSYDLDVDEIYMIAEPEVVEAMAKLPLETVYLGHMQLGTGRLELDLASIWPNVTELLMPSQPASLVELSYFAVLPNLQRLVLRLYLSSVCNPVEIPGSGHAPLRALESGDCARLSGDYDVMYHNARNLLQLWPELKTVTWSKRNVPKLLRLAEPFDEMLKLCRCYLYREKYAGVDPNHPKLPQIRWLEGSFVRRIQSALNMLAPDSSGESSESEDSE